MNRYPQRRRKLRVVALASLAMLLVVSVALFGFGVRQVVHLGRPATYRLNMVTDPEPNRTVLALVNDTRSSLATGNRMPRRQPSHLDVELGVDRSPAGPP
jgi:hypothetical protein